MSSQTRRWALFILLSAGIALGIHYRGQLDLQHLRLWLAGDGLAAPLSFILLYTIATLLLLPGSLLTLASGALFGPWLGALYSLIGATLGAAASFFAARYLTHDWVEHRTGGWLARLQRGIEAEGWRFVAFTRLVPLFPFNLLNYALGLTRIRALPYIVVSFLCMAPGTLAYAWLGHAGREVAQGDAGAVRAALLALGLLALVAYLPRLVLRLRRNVSIGE